MIFTQFYGLKFNLFSKEIPFDQLFASEDLQELTPEIFAAGAGDRLRLCGEPGCGKTSALRKYVSELNPAHYKTRYFALSTVTVLEFYQGLALALGEEPKHKKVSIFHQIQGAIANLYYEQRITSVIVLDEIHLAGNKSLEDLRLLFNFQMDYFILILTLIRSKLALNVNNPLRQRLTVKYSMRGLKADEIKEYRVTRLKYASRGDFYPGSYRCDLRRHQRAPSAGQQSGHHLFDLRLQQKAEGNRSRCGVPGPAGTGNLGGWFLLCVCTIILCAPAFSTCYP